MENFILGMAGLVSLGLITVTLLIKMWKGELDALLARFTIQFITFIIKKRGELK